MQPILADKAFPELVQWADELAALRRDIHAHPELGFETDRKSTRLNSSHRSLSRMPSSA